MPYKDVAVARVKALERYERNKEKRQQQMREYSARPDVVKSEKERRQSRVETGYYKQYYKTHRDSVLTRCREYRLQNPVFLLWQNAKQRAKKFELAFDITPDDIIIPERCPVFDVPLEYGKGKHYPWAPSLDRIIPKLGYIKGNIIVISFRANKLKGDATLAELESLVEFLKKNNTGTNL